MEFLTIQDLKLNTAKVVNRLTKRGWVIILNHGKPKAALMPLTEADIEDMILKSPSFLKSLRAAQLKYRKKLRS
ncbi:MAG: type II toxin-antitoxin system Phd/YefM family antitoxin [Candidatus Omnitrophica bacterium]|nr:type II toxin-antitoxin system Phd/YefM family antitoxin [Candidatus Omnitrophota bacterium]